MTPFDALKVEMELLKGDLIAAYKAKGMRASGDFERSLDLVFSDNGNVMQAKLKGNSYAEQLEQGRGKTNSSQRGNVSLYDAILKWISDKGITSELKPKSLAYLITRKIHNQGWDRRQYGGVNLVSSVITSERIKLIVSNVAKYIIEDVTFSLVSDLKNIKTN